MTNYPINFPSGLTVNNLQIKMLNSVAVVRSKFAYNRKAHNFTGEMWEMSGTLPLMNRDTAEAYLAFIAKLKGKYGSFLFPLPTSISSARGSWGGTPVVDGGSQTGDTLDIRGLPNNITGVARQGDYINLGTGATTRMHKVLDDANSNGSGETTINIWPSLRTSPNDGDAVAYENIKANMCLKDDVPIDIDVNRLYFIALEMEEDL